MPIHRRVPFVKESMVTRSTRRAWLDWRQWVAAWSLALVLAARAVAQESPAGVVVADPPVASGEAGDGASATAFAIPDVAIPALDWSNAWPRRVGERPVVVAAVGEPGDDFRLVRVRAAGFAPGVRDIADASGLGLGEGVGVSFEGPGALIARFVAPGPGSGTRVGGRGPAFAASFVACSAREEARGEAAIGVAPGDDGAGKGPEHVSIERTWFVVHPASRRREGERAGRGVETRRGVVLFMPGLLGTPEPTIESLVKAMTSRGWVVVRMLAQPSRFTEKAHFDLDAGAPMGPQGERIARAMSERLAECAYAVEGAMAHVEALDPTLRALPRVGVGFSAGAFTMPTVIARDPSRYAGCVMIGGGAHAWLISAHSNYRGMIDALSLAWRGAPDEATLARAGDALASAYLERCALDPFHTATGLRGSRVLIIQARYDKAVPASLGDVLWERGGRPERWIKDAGHELLFLNLYKDHDAILGWLDGFAPGTPAGAGGEPPAGAGTGGAAPGGTP